MQVIIFDKPYNKQVTLTKEQSVHIPRIGERVFVFNYTPTPYIRDILSKLLHCDVLDIFVKYADKLEITNGLITIKEYKQEV
ncbi:hypothetical protein KY334_03330 [Candidatus Woesearchaeota archaeon]|nr:hypothetical protein [Candidatus Woesearchaeota archaeon]